MVLEKEEAIMAERHRRKQQVWWLKQVAERSPLQLQLQSKEAELEMLLISKISIFFQQTHTF